MKIEMIDGVGPVLVYDFGEKIPSEIRAIFSHGNVSRREVREFCGVLEPSELPLLDAAIRKMNRRREALEERLRDKQMG